MQDGRPPLTKPHGICFDIGNVLVFPNGDMIASILNDRLGKVYDPQRCREAYMAADRQEYEHQYLRPGAGAFDYAQAWAKAAGIEQELAPPAWEAVAHTDRFSMHIWSDVHPDAAAVLKAVQQRQVLVSAVSNSDGYLEQDLRDFGLRAYFTAVVDSKVVGISKPCPEIYQMGARALHLEPDQCWYVGDEVLEMYGAERAGMGTAILFDPLGLHADVTRFVRISNLYELIGLIDQARRA